MPVAYLDASVYRHLREEGIDPAGTAIDRLSLRHDEIEITFDDSALIDLSSAFRFGDLEAGGELFKLVRRVIGDRILKHFGWLIRDEVQALLEMIPRYWWQYEDEEADKIRRLIADLSEGKYEVTAELDLRDRQSRQEAFGRVLHHLFKETSFDEEGIEDFSGLLLRYEKGKRREHVRKLMADVIRAEKPGDIARRVDTKIHRCPTAAAFVKLPLFKQYLYKMRYEDRKRGDDEEMLHLCCLAHVDILVSQNVKFRERFHLLHPDKEAHDLDGFLATAEA
ncbi:MAG: hypothetical protein ACE5JS_10010 [Nitrospinota bacterium]